MRTMGKRILGSLVRCLTCRNKDSTRYKQCRTKTAIVTIVMAVNLVIMTVMQSDEPKDVDINNDWTTLQGIVIINLKKAAHGCDLFPAPTAIKDRQWIFGHRTDFMYIH